MRSILEDLLERLNSDIKSQLKIDYNILTKWYVSHASGRVMFFSLAARV
jgi:hypothetical protein